MNCVGDADGYWDFMYVVDVVVPVVTVLVVPVIVPVVIVPVVSKGSEVGGAVGPFVGGMSSVGDAEGKFEPCCVVVSVDL